MLGSRKPETLLYEIYITMSLLDHEDASEESSAEDG